MLTRSGLGVVLAAAVLGALGMWWRYEELLVAALAAGCLVLAGIWLSQRPLRPSVTRRVVAIRVPRGDPIRVGYRVRNDGRHRSPSATIIDTCDDVELRLAMDPVEPRSITEFMGDIPTTRRGIFPLGPFRIERVDPFGLSVGSRADDRVATVVVHPKIYDLVGPNGAVRVVDSDSAFRRATSDPMSGFVSLREYVIGDDPRMIHWPTTARTGTLMVREHVEVRRPEFTVVLDTADHVATPDDFEELVDVAATIAVHAIRVGLDVVLRTTSPTHAGRASHLMDDAAVLDLLTPVQQTPATELLPVASLFANGLDHSSVVMITGPDGPSSRFSTLDRVIAVRIGHDADLEPGISIAAPTAQDFVDRWSKLLTP